MKLVVVEDDYHHGKWVCGELGRLYHETDVDLIRSEVEFLDHLQSLEERPPDAVIMDIMVGWQNPDDLAPGALLKPASAFTQTGSELSAGLRLIRKMQESERLRTVPVLIYSVMERVDLDRSDLPDHVIFVQKQQTIDRLAAVLDAALLAMGRVPKQRKKSFAELFWDALSATPRLAGFSLDLKKLVSTGQRTATRRSREPDKKD